MKYVINEAKKTINTFITDEYSRKISTGSSAPKLIMISPADAI